MFIGGPHQFYVATIWPALTNKGCMYALKSLNKGPKGTMWMCLTHWSRLGLSDLMFMDYLGWLVWNNSKREWHYACVCYDLSYLALPINRNWHSPIVNYFARELYSKRWSFDEYSSTVMYFMSVKFFLPFPRDQLCLE